MKKTLLASGVGFLLSIVVFALLTRFQILNIDINANTAMITAIASFVAVLSHDYIKEKIKS